MVDNVVHIGTTPNNMLATLDAVRQQIENGDLLSMAIVAVDRNGEVYTGEIIDGKGFALLGGINWLAGRVADMLG